MPKVLLVALNAKYIHSNLGIYSLRAYCRQKGIETQIAEYTINHRMEYILGNIYEKKPDIVAFSCYIWNISMIHNIATELHKILPEVPIWFGGPEVSYEVEKKLQKYPYLTGVMFGEGEETLYELLCYYEEKSRLEDMKGAVYQEQDSFKDIRGITYQKQVSLKDIKGIAYREKGEIFCNEKRPLLSLDDIPFAYDDLEDLQNRIIYYETSRGCPFRCSYCLSAAECGVRFRSMELVEKELAFFLEHKVPQVKFVDRTFNANQDHTMAIWKYIHEHDNGITNFHFEISADLLQDEEIAYLRQFRKGLVQFEIGVQSTNPETIQAIDRKMDLDRLKTVVARIREGGNIHEHLDLIAGLPYEDIVSFRHSFDAVYAMRPDQLQLGFLKVLNGAPISYQREDWHIVYQDVPPYEVLYTKWLTYDDVLELKGIEEMVEIYYNSGQFLAAIKYLECFFDSSYALYASLWEYYRAKELQTVSHSRIRRYEILLFWAEETLQGKRNSLLFEKNIFQEMLLYDLYSRENLKSRPSFLPEETDREKHAACYREKAWCEKYLPAYAGYTSKQLLRMTHMESFSFDLLHFLETGKILPVKKTYLFDYMCRDPLHHQARVLEMH